MPADPVAAAVYDRFIDVFSFVLGSLIGSFLNVCIYRLPLGLSVNEPKRSFCPHCKNQLRWYHNLPIVSWLVLRGKCGFCGAPISVRYPLVELLTAVLFFAVWRRFSDVWILVPAYWVFVSLVIVATFIDFDHFIIPHEITFGCMGAGLALSLVIPLLMGEDSHAWGFVWSLVGAGAGYLLLWGVVEAGKLAFGKKRVVLPEPLGFTWEKIGADDAALKMASPRPLARPGSRGLRSRFSPLRKRRLVFRVLKAFVKKPRTDSATGDDTLLWSEYFARTTDRLILLCEPLQLAGREHATATLYCFWDRLELDGQTYPLDKLDTFSGQVKEYVFPREAMGFGDVYFLAGIGAFLGWKAILFTVALGSLVGSVVGITLLVLGPKTRSLKIPFGPYLSVGALLWLFAGPGIVAWYLGLMGR